MPVPRVALLLVVSLVAGCTSPAVVQDPPPAGEGGLASEPTFAVHETPLECGSCFEATLAADPQGRLFVVAAGTSTVLVSEDDGVTWTERAGPDLPAGLTVDVADALVQVAPDGALYFSALVAERLTVGAPGLFGILVAWSTDGAATWEGSALLTPAHSVGAPIVWPDRQWLGFAPDGALYLTYNQIPTGIWIARSDDRGASWSGWTRALPLEDRAGAGQSGPPIVDAEGTVYVPGCRLAPESLSVYVSKDGGQTFAREDVPSSGCAWFPLLALAPDGSVVAAWSALSGVTEVSVRDAATGAWSEAVEWTASSVTSPWPLPRADGALDLAWIGGDDGTDVHLSHGPLRGPPEDDVVVAEGLDAGGGSHYAHGVRLADGRLALTWTADAAVSVAVASAGTADP